MQPLDQNFGQTETIIFDQPLTAQTLATLMDDLFEGKVAASRDDRLHRLAETMPRNYATVEATQRAIEVICGKVVAALMQDDLPKSEVVVLTAMNDALIKALLKCTALKLTTPNPARPPAGSSTKSH